MNAIHRAGFSQSRALFRKMWGPSPGAAGLIFPGKTGDLFSHHRLSAVSSAASPLFICSWKTDDFLSSLSLLFISVWCHPLEGVIPHLLYLSDLVCLLFFVNSATKIRLVRVSPPWMVSPGTVRPPPTDATVASYGIAWGWSQSLALTLMSRIKLLLQWRH